MSRPRRWRCGFAGGVGVGDSAGGQQTTPGWQGPGAACNVLQLKHALMRVSIRTGPPFCRLQLPVQRVVGQVPVLPRPEYR